MLLCCNISTTYVVVRVLNILIPIPVLYAILYGIHAYKIQVQVSKCYRLPYKKYIHIQVLVASMFVGGKVGAHTRDTKTDRETS
jgi:hypothetical protein